jgi:hypothetical protein
MTGQYLKFGTVIGKITAEGGIIMAVVTQQGYTVTAWIPWEETGETTVQPGQKYTLSKIGNTYSLGQRLVQAD